MREIHFLLLFLNEKRTAIVYSCFYTLFFKTKGVKYFLTTNSYIQNITLLKIDQKNYITFKRFKA